ncbi:hypothetical protein C355_04639 [Cryptococcus neoformans Th84]|nr:hypothetical protein C355_04639 [Cryptococcus neoformans var. grubii Th84]
MERPAYLQDANPGKILRHQLDGSCYQVDDQDVQRERGCLVLTINVSIDWADPSKSRNRSPRSMGPIMCQLADLPNKYRSQYSFAMLMGITPAPNEPPGCLLHRLLLPLAVDLLSADCDGLWIKTPKYPNGRKVYARIGTICCDRPASVAITGCAHFRRKDSPCLKCLVRVGQLHSTRKHPARSGVEHSEAMLAQQCEFLRQFEQAPQTARQTHVARRAGHLTKATQAHIETLEKSIFAVPGHLSALDLFPNFDKFLHAVVDPMHALLEGILPFYMRKVLVLGRYCALPPAGWTEDEDAVSLCSTDSEGEGSVHGDGLHEVYDQIVEQSGSSEDPRAIERLQQYAARVLPQSKVNGKPILAQTHLYRLESMMEEVIYPPYIDRIGRKFFTKLSKPTASQWRTFGEVLGPLVMPWLWAEASHQGKPLPPEELSVTLKLFAVIRYTLQSSISEAQVAQLRKHIDSFRALVAKLHPFLPARVTNFHIIEHIPDDILAHGPVYGWWLFSLERLNGHIKNIKMSGRNMVQEQVVALRALLRERFALQRLKQVMRCEIDPADTAEYKERLVDCFGLGGLNVGGEDDADDLAYYDNSGLDQEFSLDLLSHGRRSEGSADKEVFCRFLREYLPRMGQQPDRPGGEGITDTFEFHHELRVRGYRFRPLDPTFKEEWIVDGATQLPRLLNRSNACSFLECRPPLRRFGEFHQPTMTGILWTVFSHIQRAPDGRILSHRLFGVFRWFKPSAAYGYRYDEEKTLDIQVFSQHQLSPPFFLPIHAKSLPSIHPVSLISVPQRSSAPLGTKVIVTIPIARHT